MRFMAALQREEIGLASADFADRKPQRRPGWESCIIKTKSRKRRRDGGWIQQFDMIGRKQENKTNIQPLHQLINQRIKHSFIEIKNSFITIKQKTYIQIELA